MDVRRGGGLARAGGVGAGRGLLGWFVLRTIGVVRGGRFAAEHARWLTAGESVVVVQKSPEEVCRAILLLRNSGEGHPSVFTIRERPDIPAAEEPVRTEPLSSTRLQRYARRLASSHRVGADVRRKEPLLRQLDRCEETIERVRRRLAEASRMEQEISATAEWILDNAYIIQGQIDDVRRHLPKRFYRELPVLASEPGSGEPRLYHLAVGLVRHADHRLDRAGIEEFLSAYQSIVSLTMGELWAAPLMLRIALLDALRRMAGQIDRRLHEEERADFWANRLLTAARRDPGRMFAILAELAREMPEPSAHFAFQLTGPLYDAEEALVPVRSWLERTRGTSLAEIVAQEDSGRRSSRSPSATRSRACGSSRGWTGARSSSAEPVEALLRNDPADVYRRMEFATRDRYRHAVEELSRASNIPRRMPPGPPWRRPGNGGNAEGTIRGSGTSATI